MLVRALKSFGGSRGHVPEGHVFELPDDVDWLQVGLVEPVEPEAEKATSTRARKRRTTARRGKKTTE